MTSRDERFSGVKKKVLILRRVAAARAGEMIPEVEGTWPWGSSRKRVLSCLKGSKTTYTIIAIAEKQYKRSEKGPFLLYIGSLWVPPRKWN